MAILKLMKIREKNHMTLKKQYFRFLSVICITHLLLVALECIYVLQIFLL